MEYGGIPAQTHPGGDERIQRRDGEVQGWEWLDSRRGKPGGVPFATGKPGGCSLCQGTEQEFGRPEEQFGSETTHGLLLQRGRNWVERKFLAVNFKSH